jgi:hypothetical protein
MNEGFTAQGEVDLEGPTIGSDLDCTGGHFAGTVNQRALSASGAVIKGDVFLGQEFVAQGEVDLEGTSIGSNLECDGGQFHGGAKSPALEATGANIQGSVLLDRSFDSKEGFLAEGRVVFANATIGGDLDCEGARLASKGDSTAFDAQGAKIDGSAYIRSNISLKGDVKFTFATVARDIRWTCVRDARLDLQHGKAGSILMDLTNSPSTGDVRIDGFVYDQIDELSSANSANPLRWIGLQPHDTFLPQRFEQLYSVLRKMGFQEDAMRVMITKNQEAGDIALAEASNATGKDLTKKRYLKVLADLLTGAWDISWYKLFGNFIGYGYTPWHALYASLSIVGIG